MDEIAIVVPFRLGGLTRLAGALSQTSRQELAIAMLSDVVGAIREAALEPTIAAADEPTRAAVNDRLSDVACVVDPGDGGLDADVAVHAGSHPGGQLVIMADLPTLRPGEIDRVIGEPADVIVADTEDGGTGALLRRPSEVIATAYGAGSAGRHVEMAAAAAVRWARLELPGFRCEIDLPEDLRRAADWPLGPATSRALRPHQT